MIYFLKRKPCVLLKEINFCFPQQRYVLKSEKQGKKLVISYNFMLKDNKSFFSVLSFMALLHVKHIVEKIKRFHGLNDVWSQGVGEGLVICVTLCCEMT